MFFESLIFTWFMNKFDQNDGDIVNEICGTTTVRDVQNCTC